MIATTYSQHVEHLAELNINIGTSLTLPDSGAKVNTGNQEGIIMLTAHQTFTWEKGIPLLLVKTKAAS